MRTHTKHEQGFVSLFSTIFFMLLITVITLGFIQIMSTEQAQATNNDLSDSALASAQSGIEDGKRAILKYMSLPGGVQKNTYYTQMTSPKADTCDAITGSSIATDLGLSATGNVVNNAQFDQAYSCLSVNLNSPDFLSQSTAGKSQIVPLKALGNTYTQVKVSWHLLSSTVGADGDGLPGSPAGSSPYYAAGPLLYPQVASGVNPSWSKYGYPAYLRVQLFGYPSSGSFGRAQMTQLSRTVLLVPTTSGAYSSTTPINLGSADPNPGVFGQAELQPSTVTCDGTPGVDLGAYACTALLQLPAGAQYASTANNYFLRITPIYGQTHFRVAMVNGGTEVPFDQVQPIVDATGRASNVYRRLQARVLVNALTNFPEYSLESANTICKNLQVSNNTADYRANTCP